MGNYIVLCQVPVLRCYDVSAANVAVTKHSLSQMGPNHPMVKNKSLTIVHVLDSSPAFRHTVTTTYCKRYKNNINTLTELKLQNTHRVYKIA